MSDDHIPDVEIVGCLKPTCDGDATARRGLAGDGDVAVRDLHEIGFNDSTHLEYDDTRAGLIQRILQAAGSARGERGYLDHTTTSAAGGQCPEALRSGKRADALVHRGRGR